MKEDFVLIFLHLPKCGGRTLTEIIKRQYHYKIRKLFGSEFFYSVTSISDNESFKKLPKHKIDKIRFLSGHMNFGLHKYFSMPVKYITILREPIDRIISHYYYVKRNPQHYLYKKITDNNLSLIEYVTSGISTELNNGMVRLLSGLNAEYNKCNTEMFEIAKENIENYFPIVGTLEKFDETIMLMRNYFKWNYPFYIKTNVTKKRPVINSFDEKEILTIKEFNKLDIQLYNWINLRLNDQLRNFNSELKSELLKFKRYNKIYSLFRNLL